MKDSPDNREKFMPRYVPKSFSGLKAKNIYVNGRRTSVRLEEDMWVALREVASFERVSQEELFGAIWEMKGSDASFASAVRTFLVTYYRHAALSRIVVGGSTFSMEGKENDGKRGVVS